MSFLIIHAEGQQTRSSTKRFGGKPGEIVTRRDTSMRWRDQLQVGGFAPEFSLPLLTKASDAGSLTVVSNTGANSMVSLKELRSKRAVVLVFGSITCPPFRSQLDGIDEVYEQFKDKAEFLFVYVREAHPNSVLSIEDEKGNESLRTIPQAANAEERKQAAIYCQRSIQLQLPIAVDSIDNKVGQAYAGWPNRMVVVDTHGKIVYASNPAPGGTNGKNSAIGYSKI